MEERERKKDGKIGNGRRGERMRKWWKIRRKREKGRTR